MRLEKQVRPGTKEIIAVLAAVLMLSCAVGVEEYTEGFILASVTTFQVADSSRADSISVRLAGTIGESTAYTFNRIDTTQTGTLFQIAVWGHYRESSKEVYPPTPPSFDTTLILQSPLLGQHSIQVNSLSGILLDSTIVY